MSLAIHLLRPPTYRHTDGDTYNFRSRKSWAVLAYLILSERLPTRSQFASLLFTRRRRSRDHRHRPGAPAPRPCSPR
jgi:hypothetical protein